MLFVGASLQQWGMRYTTAGNAGFITGLYVVLVPLLLAVFWHQKPRRSIVIAALVAATGLYLLSTGGSLRLNPGDGLELGGAFLWAGHVILIGWLAQRANVFRISIGQNLICGLLSLGAFALLAQPDPWLGLKESWWAIVYTGVLSIGIGYTLQIVGQREAPPSDAAIILSGEAVFAALFGWLWLNEQLSGIQLLGCGLILAGMFLAQYRYDRS
jgi:drug/metabolite transporter (DMT)-like permease